MFEQTALLSASIPGGFGVGSAYLDALLQSKNGQQLRAIHPGTQSAREGLAIEDWPEERYRRTLPGRLGTLASISHYRRNRRQATAIARRIDSWCQSAGIKQVWIVLESPLTYRLACLLSQNTQLDLVATVWDPPDSVSRQFGLDRISGRTAVEDFYHAVRGCTRLGVISDEMGQHLTNASGSPASTVMRFVPTIRDEERVVREAKENQSNEFIIAFAGSLYASAEFNALLAALDHCAWKIQDRPVRVKVMGAAIHYKTKQPACIEFLGYRTSVEVHHVMAAANCGYVPYWFDPEYKNAVELCFPSKLITCLSSRTPIFFHGPETSTPATFLKQYAAGVGCHATESSPIVRSLESLAATARSSFAYEASRAVNDEFNSDNFQQRFHWLITGANPTA